MRERGGNRDRIGRISKIRAKKQKGDQIIGQINKGKGLECVTWRELGEKG